MGVIHLIYRSDLYLISKEDEYILILLYRALGCRPDWIGWRRKPG